MKQIDFLFQSTTGISCSNINEMLAEFSNLSLFELENIRCTAEQHKIVNFLIEFRKMNDGLLLSKDDNAVQQIREFYEESLHMNSPHDKELVL